MNNVKVTRGKIHEYLAMALDYSIPLQVIIDMKQFIYGIIQEHPYKTNKKVICLWNKKLFYSDRDVNELENKEAENFHTFVMKYIFLAKCRDLIFKWG